MKLGRAAIGMAALSLGLFACRPDWEPSQPLPPATCDTPACWNLPGSPPANHAPAAPVIDGTFAEWSSATRLIHDRLGDASGAFDVTELHATSRGAQLFVHFDTTTLLNLSSGPASDGTLQLNVTLPDERVLSLDFRARQLSVSNAGVLSSYDFGYIASPTHAGNAFELTLDLDPFGIAPGDTVWLSLEGSDQVAPQPFTFEYGTPTAPPSLSAARPPGSSLRLASFNTLYAGLTDISRRDAMGRLLRAAQADVYLLQEMGNTPASQVKAAFAAADPHDDGAPWNVLIAGTGSVVGNAIVSRSDIVAIKTPTPRFIGAVVTLPAGPVAVFAVHLKCCGYIGSDEDNKRMTEVGQLAQVIANLRAGTAGEALWPFADVPVVVAGDFNDVGSPQLRQVLQAPSGTGSNNGESNGAGLTRLPLPHLTSADVFTWYQHTASFPPGVLDLMFYGGALTPANGFLLDSRQLDGALLDQLQLASDDSDASDHLMLVADFTVLRRLVSIPTVALRNPPSFRPSVALRNPLTSPQKGEARRVGFSAIATTLGRKHCLARVF